MEKRLGPLDSVSSFKTTNALLPEKNSAPQPDYLNGVCRILTTKNPDEVIDILMAIEKDFGRKRHPDHVWGPRTLDLDFICANSQVINSKKLTLPHPQLHKRLFVLEPLAEIWPDWQHPLLKCSAKMLLEHALD